MVVMGPSGSRAAKSLQICLAVLFMASATSCLARRRVITRQGGAATQTLLVSEKDALIGKIAGQFAAIETLNATVDMVPALGSANKGKITEYKDVRAYILFRKPRDIRIIGLYPVVRNKAFDMVSDGSEFSVYIPSRNRFIQGKNQMEAPSANKIENLRPQHFLDALLVQPVEPDEQTILANLTDEENAAYILSLISKGENGEPRLDRQIWFDRLRLEMVRQIIFDAAGDILTDARYHEWQNYDKIRFPKRIEINRPKDEYGVVITIVKMDVNAPLTDDKFALERPAGTTLQVVGAPAGAAPQADKGSAPQ
jgi:outer membrane lipoprotein-sorting protein